ncbi:MAG TPA: PQQ-dependent sugar dehydrogenase [Anaerolineales bacterium]|nr:PQQ-dependent sugar dehydrogenase [Anaerolineales bacterium]
MRKHTLALFLLLTACNTGGPTATTPAPAAQTVIPPAETLAPPDTPAATEASQPDATASPLPPEPTEAPPLPPGPLVFAAIGDFGLQGPDAAAVAELVKSWDPELIITLGDNNYPDGSFESIDANIGQYYHEFIFPYPGEYGPGADINRFFPSPGNHDWGAPGLEPYLDYFTLPGNERYYDFVWGPVHFFALDSDTREPDGVGLSSVQAQWLQVALASSTSPWQIVYMHHPPYSSARHGSTDYIQWPFAEWGVDAVLAGHDHVYERLEIDGIPYIVNGLGGYPARYFFFLTVPGSQFQYRSGHGALRAVADETSLTFEMITVEGEVLDTVSVDRAGAAGSTSVTTLPDPAAFDWEPVATGFDRPVLLTHPGDGSGRLFVVEQDGLIRIIGRDTPFLDLTGLVTTSGNEQGLLGLAFDPDFTANGYFYVNYTATNGDTVVARYTALAGNPDLGDPGSAVELLRVTQPYANHNGGHLAFGPDGLLYIGLGDGGLAGDPQGRAQNPLSLLGKMLQLDVHTGELEIYALGLRNPWRYSFDPVTGDLYIGDVGQGQWEEVNFLAAGSPPGANFGWDYFEGSHAYEGTPPDPGALIMPIVEYSHSGGGCSVTGGHVYRGADLPEFYGVYLFGDYCTGTVWGMLRGSDGSWTADLLFGLNGEITSFGVDEAGEVYAVARDGTIYKLVKQ